MSPTLSEEKKLWQKGYKLVAGLDEAGRGPLAGPVVAGAVVIVDVKHLQRCRCLTSTIRLRDSKQLSARQREKFYKIITCHSAIKWGVGIVSEKVIDKINILEATKLAMKKAVRDLKSRAIRFRHFSHDREKSANIDFLILDGKMEIDLPIPQKSIVKADEKVFSCAAASILAKVTRDMIMTEYHKKYPQYGFDKHNGYGTKYHYQMIKEYGPCQIHRKSYRLYK